MTTGSTTAALFLALASPAGARESLLIIGGGHVPILWHAAEA
jgi:hypothetical protein